MHFLNNAVSVVSGYVAQNGGFLSFITVIEKWIYSSPAGLAVGFIAVIVCAGLLVLMFYTMRKDAVKNGIINAKPFEPAVGINSLSRDIPFILTVLLGIGATVFSLAWGLMR